MGRDGRGSKGIGRKDIGDNGWSPHLGKAVVLPLLQYVHKDGGLVDDACGLVRDDDDDGLDVLSL
jgi:hypothetical protein